MPDLKDKYTDPELDRSDKAFDEIVSRPDMKALDDQGDATARELGRAEGSAKASRGPSDINAGDDARDAESNPDSPSDSGLYRPNNKPARMQGSVWSRRKKAASLGIGGGFIGLIVAAAFMFLPMKIIAIMDTIINDTGQRVEQLTEERAKLILGRAILTKFGTHTGIVLTGEGAFKTLVASMRTSGFEKRLAAKGLTINTTPDGIKLTYKGNPLGGGATFKNEKDIINALEKNKLTNKMLKDVIKEDIPSWRWMKRAKFAKWLRIKYGIPRYGIINNSSEPDDEKRASEIQKSRLTLAYKRVVTNALNAFDCILGDKCVADNLGDSTKENLKTGGDNLAVTGAIDEAGALVTAEHSDNPFKAVLSKLTDTLLGKFATKAIPIIGWIDLVATLDHIAYEALENDYFAKIPAYFRGLQYAQMFGEWSGYSDQQKLGALDHAATGPLANQLDGAETSQAFNYIDGDASRGEPIKLKVDSNNPSKYKEFWEDYRQTTNNIPGTPGGYSTHYVLNLYYKTIGGGGFLGWIADKAGNLISDLASFLTPQAFQDWLGEVVKKGLTKMLDYFGLTIDPLDSGPDLFNDLHAGGTVSFNDYCKEIGCRKLSPEQANASNTQIAAERASDIREKGVFYAMFSPENTRSLTSKLAIALPAPENADIGMFATRLGSLITNAPSNLFGLFAPRSSASTNYVDLYGIDPYGATQADLNQGLTDEFVSGDECPGVAEGAFDSCRVDTEVASAMECEFKSDSAGCSDAEKAVEKSSGGANFRIATFNIYYSSNESSPDYSIRMWEERLKRSSKVILDNNLEVVGLQEVRQNQWQRIQDDDMLGGRYEIYPKNYAEGGYGSQNPIVWDTNIFELVEGKAIAGYQVLGPKNSSANIQVKLRYKASGQEVYVINQHEPVGNDNIQARLDAAKDRYAYIKELSKEKIPVFITGDFNSSYQVNSRQKTVGNDRNNLAYCVLTENALMWDAFDAAKGKTGRCPSTDGPGVDHIFMSTDVKAKNYDNSISPRGNGSDVHKTVFVDVEVPGSGGALGGLTVATYNVKVPGQTDSPNDGWLHSSERMPIIAEVVKENGVDVVGFQEVEPGTFRLLSDNLPEYDSYPKNAASAVGKSWMDPIFWLKDDFELVDKGEFKRSYRMCPGVQLCDDAVWVKLREKSSGDEFYYMSLHMVNRNPYTGPNKSADGGAEKREADSHEVVRVIKEEFDPSVPVFFVGDLNSSWDIANTGDDKALNGNRNRLPYCILTESSLLINSYDSVDGKSGHCPSPNRPYEIDHIYVSPSLKIASSKQIINEKTQKASDHKPIIAKVATSGSKGSVGDWSWPLDKKWWISSRYDFVDPHTADSGTWTSGIRSLAVDIGVPPSGSPVYAMIGGTVSRADLGGHGLVIKSSVQGGVLEIAYGHGPRTNKNSSYKTGARIMSVGALGNVTGAHLHIDMSFTKNGVEKGICPQDVFIALGADKEPELEALTKRAAAPCGGRS